jgi:transposase
MFHLHEKLHYYLYPGTVDMRKSFFTLSGIVTSVMNREVENGEAFIFINRRRNIMKILHNEYGGLVIYHKKLSSGTFRLPLFDESTNSLTMKWHELMMIVQEVKATRRVLRKH